MTRHSFALIGSVLAVAFTAHVSAQRGAPRTLSLDEILARHVQAKGGIEKIKAVQTVKQTGKLSMQGLNATITIYAKRPNSVRQEIQFGGQTMVQAFDGTTAWGINPMVPGGGPTLMAAPEAAAIRDQSDFDSPLVDSAARGFKVELIGSEKLGEKNVYHLKVTSKTNMVQHCYLDALTLLETKVTTDSPAGSLEQEMEDFRDVEGGLKYPFLIRTLSAGMQQTKLTYESVEPNAKFDDALFKMPVK